MLPACCNSFPERISYRWWWRYNRKKWREGRTFTFRLYLDWDPWHHGPRESTTTPQTTFNNFFLLQTSRVSRWPEILLQNGELSLVPVHHIRCLSASHALFMYHTRDFVFFSSGVQYFWWRGKLIRLVLIPCNIFFSYFSYLVSLYLLLLCPTEEAKKKRKKHSSPTTTTTTTTAILPGFALLIIIVAIFPGICVSSFVHVACGPLSLPGSVCNKNNMHTHAFFPWAPSSTNLI